jgi:TonB family protein
MGRMCIRFATASVVMLSATMCVASEVQSRSSAGDSNYHERIPLRTVVPTYPEKARRQRIEGTVQVCFNIDRKGKTYRIAVRSSSNRLFEKPSIKAVRESSYRPLAEDASDPGIKSCRTFHFFLDPVQNEHNDGSNSPVE